jgi:two-component system chemotaxis response regulator CheY
MNARKKTVMVVDDSISLRQAICASLKDAGYDTLEAGDGFEACGRLDGRRINLVICDVNMPNMDGISFVKQMRTSDTYRYTPVLMLTTESSESKRDLGQLAGAKAWLVKPFQPERVLSAVAKLIRP